MGPVVCGVLSQPPHGALLLRAVPRVAAWHKKRELVARAPLERALTTRPLPARVLEAVEETREVLTEGEREA